MRKIPTIYQRDPATKLKYVMAERHPDCGWVFDGEGRATYKWDGTAVQVLDGEVWQRREVKDGKEPPHTFRQEGDADLNTGKRVGWVLADLEGDPGAKWLAEAYYAVQPIPDGTYELVGPKVQSNPHGFTLHGLEPHGSRVFDLHPDIQRIVTEFDNLGPFLHGCLKADEGFEGIVWHHPDGRMAKIKVRDFPKPHKPEEA